MILLNNVSVDATSEEFQGTGGAGVLNVRATSFGGGVVNIQVKSINDVNDRWVNINVPKLSIEAGATTDIDYDISEIIYTLHQGLKYRAVLTGSSGASNVFVEII